MELATLKTWNGKIYGDNSIYLNGTKITDENIIQKVKAFKLISYEILNHYLWEKKTSPRFYESYEWIERIREEISFFILKEGLINYTAVDESISEIIPSMMDQMRDHQENWKSHLKLWFNF